MYSGKHRAECHRCFILREKWQLHTIHNVGVAYLHAATYVENGEFTFGAEFMSPSPPRYGRIDSPRFFSRSP